MLTETENNVETIEKKIIFILEIYPCISKSMLQIAIGSSLPADFWKPIFEKLVEEGTITVDALKATDPKGRLRSYSLIRLTKNVD